MNLPRTVQAALGCHPGHPRHPRHPCHHRLSRRTPLTPLALTTAAALMALSPSQALAQPTCVIPDLLGSYNTRGTARDVTVVGTTAYVADGASGLQILDVSDPANPVWLGAYNTPDIARGVTLLGTTAYVADGGSGLQILDVTPNAEICLADCDKSTGPCILDIFDFLCFQESFVAGDPYACDCDTSTGNGVCDIFDFLCFQNAFVNGCS